MTIDKETAYAIFRDEAHTLVKRGTPHVKEEGLENEEFFFAPIAAREAFNGDDRFLNDPGTPVTLVKKDDGKIVHMLPQSRKWIDLRKKMKPVNYLAD